MGHPSFRGCEKRVLDAVAEIGTCTKYQLRQHLTAGKLPISNSAVITGTRTCVHNGYLTEEDNQISLTEKGKVQYEQGQLKRKVNPVPALVV